MCGASEEKKAPGAVKPSLTVTVDQPQSASLAQKLSANGNLAAWQEASVGAESSGLRLAEVRVNVGDVVKRGQLLASFATDTVAAELAQGKASVAEAAGHRGRSQPPMPSARAGCRPAAR